MTSARLVCPSCEKPDGLWAAASFEGWHSVEASVDNRRRLKASTMGTPYYEITGSDPIDLFLEEMGCSCGWEGHVDDLVQLGIDARPLPSQIPGQGTLIP